MTGVWMLTGGCVFLVVGAVVGMIAAHNERTTNGPHETSERGSW